MTTRRCRVCRFRGEVERCPKCGAACDPVPALGPPPAAMVAVAWLLTSLEAAQRPARKPMDYMTEAAIRANQEDL